MSIDPATAIATLSKVRTMFSDLHLEDMTLSYESLDDIQHDLLDIVKVIDPDLHATIVDRIIKAIQES